MTERGTYIEHDDRPAVRFRRTYARPVARLWRAITEPDELSHWFASRVSIQPRVGGTVTFSDDPNTEPTTGEVLVFDPPHRLAYTWGGEELHFHLEPAGADGCALTMIHVLRERDTAARTAAGWSVCFAELGKHVAGAPAAGPHSDTAEDWTAHYDAYVTAGMPSGAPIPCRA